MMTKFTVVIPFVSLIADPRMKAFIRKQFLFSVRRFAECCILFLLGWI